MSTNSTTDPILLAVPNDPTAPVVAAVATTTTATNKSSEHGGVADNDNEDASEVAVETKGERGKFLPRVKGLLSKENEELLTKLVDVLELSGCAAFRAAAVDNPWFEAFDRFYDAIEEEYVKPTGKNRVHKFRNKILDLWQTMEAQIESHEKSPSDPIYSRAMRQWSVHQSVMKNPEAEMAKPIMMETTTTTTPTLKTATPGSHHHRQASNTSHAHGTTTGGNTNIMLATTSASSFVTTEYELERIRKSVLRLERMMVLNGWAQPKLPSPLNELHYLKEQMTTTHFDVMARETYQREIGKYLTAARHQARYSNAPAHLPQLLDGLDTLRNTAQPPQLSWSIKETYDFVLRAYLQLLEPSSHEATATPARKRKREEPASPAVAATAAPPTDLTNANQGEGAVVVGNKTGEEEIVEIV